MSAYSTIYLTRNAALSAVSDYYSQLLKDCKESHAVHKLVMAYVETLSDKYLEELADKAMAAHLLNVIIQ